MRPSTPTRRALRRPPGLPLVYSCSGCSSAAQMANHLALQLDRAGLAEMSCIAGVGGGVEGLVRTARSGRRLVLVEQVEPRIAALMAYERAEGAARAGSRASADDVREH